MPPRHFRRRFTGKGTLAYRSSDRSRVDPIASVRDLSPVGLSAHEHLTSSYYALFQGWLLQAGPWLSVHSHILSHLATIWGPLADGLGYLSATELSPCSLIPRALD